MQSSKGEKVTRFTNYTMSLLLRVTMAREEHKTCWCVLFLSLVQSKCCFSVFKEVMKGFRLLSLFISSCSVRLCEVQAFDSPGRKREFGISSFFLS